jgi:hypothetical protein
VGSANLFESNLFVAALAHSLSKAFESSRLLALACNHGFFKTKGFIEPKGSRWVFLGSVKRPYVQLSSPGRQKG